jgi:hypothetical protein
VQLEQQTFKIFRPNEPHCPGARVSCTRMASAVDYTQSTTPLKVGLGAKYDWILRQ